MSHRTPSLVLARAVLLVTGALTLVFGTSAAFVGEATDEAVLASTFGAGMGLLVLAAGWQVTSPRPSRLLWAALCYLPVFFVVHLAAFGAWVPDLPLLAATVLALAVTARHAFGGARPAVHRTDGAPSGVGGGRLARADHGA